MLSSYLRALGGRRGAAGRGAGGAPLPHRADVHRPGDRARQAGAARRSSPARWSSAITSSCCRCRCSCARWCSTSSFKQGADVHIFWPHYFAPYFALASARWRRRSRELTAWLGERPRPARCAARASGLAPWVALVARRLAGRARPRRTAFRWSGWRARRAAASPRRTWTATSTRMRCAGSCARYPESVGVGYHASVHASWALQWEPRPRPVDGNQTSSARRRRGRASSSSTRGHLAGGLKYARRALPRPRGRSLWVMDRAEPAAPLDGYALDEREPSLVGAVVARPVEPVRRCGRARGSPGSGARCSASRAPPPDRAGDARRAPHRAQRGARAQRRQGGGGAARALRGAQPATRGHVRRRHDAARRRPPPRRPAQHHAVLRRGQVRRRRPLQVHAKVVARRACRPCPPTPPTWSWRRSPTWPTSSGAGAHLRFDVVYRKRPGTECSPAAWSPGPRRTDNGRGPLELIRL